MRINKARKALWDKRRKEGISVVVTYVGGNKYTYEVKRWPQLVEEAKLKKKPEVRVEMTFTNGEMTSKVSEPLSPEVQEAVRNRMTEFTDTIMKKNPSHVLTFSPTAHQVFQRGLNDIIARHAA